MIRIGIRSTWVAMKFIFGIQVSCGKEPWLFSRDAVKSVKVFCAEHFPDVDRGVFGMPLSIPR
jgi:hypothetical protein